MGRLSVPGLTCYAITGISALSQSPVRVSGGFCALKGGGRREVGQRTSYDGVVRDPSQSRFGDQLAGAFTVSECREHRRRVGISFLIIILANADRPASRLVPMGAHRAADGVKPVWPDGSPVAPRNVFHHDDPVVERDPGHLVAAAIVPPLLAS
jgi:hypothetical protein